MRWPAFPVVLAALALAPAAFGAAGVDSQPPARLVVDGRPTLPVWLAVTEEARVLGVHGQPLRFGTGLWFGWPGRTSSAFWMRGVSYPLLIVWVGSDRRVIGVRRMEPCSRAAPNCPHYQPPRPYRWAIELRPADLRRSGLHKGAAVRLQRPA